MGVAVLWKETVKNWDREKGQGKVTERSKQEQKGDEVVKARS